MNVIDMEDSSLGNISGGGSTSTGGIKLQDDGKIGFFQMDKFQVSKQQVMEWLAWRRATIRPWKTVFSSDLYKVPENAQKVPRRLIKNLEYFQSNYLFVFLGFFLYCLITSPFLLLVMVLLFIASYWVFTNNRLAVVFGHQLTVPQQFSILGLCSMPILYLAGAGAVLFWVIGASFFLIMTHTLFFDIEGFLYLPEESFDLQVQQVV